jgi:hypothetical protein
MVAGQNRDIKIANRSFENVPFGPEPSVFSFAVEKSKN